MSIFKINPSNNKAQPKKTLSGLGKARRYPLLLFFMDPSENRKEGRNGRQHGALCRKAVSSQFPSHPKVCAGNPSGTEIWRRFFLSPREASI